MISGQAFVKRSPQALLKDYLQCELYHAIGSYSVARDRFAALEEEMRQARGALASGEQDRDAIERDKLLHVTRLAREYNDKLARERHWADRSLDCGGERELRHPIPDKLPLTLVERFDTSVSSATTVDARRNPWASPVAWAWVVNFYEAAIVAIGASVDEQEMTLLETQNKRAAELALPFAESVVWPRDRVRGARRPSDEQMSARKRIRLRRFEQRVNTAFQQLPGVARKHPSRSADPAEFLHRIATDNLSSGIGSVPLFVVSALAEAHLSMHAVEGWLSMSLGARAERAGGKDPWHLQQWLHKELDRCIVLNTFVYCAGRTAPWMFAEDAGECKTTFDEIEQAWDHAVPTRCMWISAQISLLALHRRAYSRALKGEHKDAYDDYHKLQRQIRDARRRVEDAPIHITGALDFLTALNSRAHQSIGELYRAEHAHRPALKHYSMAIESLDDVTDGDPGEMDEVLINSRWYVQLRLSQGKASYEMGQHKNSLRWHLLAWCAFLKLLAAETHTAASTAPIDKATEWLDGIKFEPELRKREVSEMLWPVVDQLERIRVSERLGALAADILLRLGHVLFVLNLAPEAATQPEELSKGGVGVVETLSFACLRKAVECDPYSTLAGADVIKSYFRTVRALKRKLPDRRIDEFPKLKLPGMAEVAKQWPRGSDDYERLDRAVEYLMLLALEPNVACPEDGDGVAEQDLRIATDLLLSFFMHTDSINVRKAQTHRFLMHERNKSKPPGADGEPAIELVCMRRYSSAFPLLPRPSAFRAHGGGYFLRLHPPRPHDVHEDSEHNRREPKRAAAHGSEGDRPGTRLGCGHPQASCPVLDAKPEQQRAPFGIVVDPGPDFVENLYRTGFSLSDIDMIIVTHDHVDHLNSLEPVLSLLYYRSDLVRHQTKAAGQQQDEHQPQPQIDAQAESAGTGDSEARAGRYPASGAPDRDAPSREPGEPRLLPYVYCNKSVLKRYRRVAALNPRYDKDGRRLKDVRFRPIQDLAKGKWQPEEFKDFNIVSISSKAVDGEGHLDLSDKPSHGICCSHREMGIAITSDTPAPPGEDDREKVRTWREKWQSALRADVLVTHMSTVPLAELRQMAKLDARLVIRRGALKDLIEQTQETRDEAKKAAFKLGAVINEVRQLLRDKKLNDRERSAIVMEAGAIERVRADVQQIDDGLDSIGQSADKLCRPPDEAKPEPKKAIDRLEKAAAAIGEQALSLHRSVVVLRRRQTLADMLQRLANGVQAVELRAQDLPRDAVALERIRERLQDADEERDEDQPRVDYANQALRGRIEFAMWLRSRRPGYAADLVGEVPDSWRPPREHPYLGGTLRWARAYRSEREAVATNRAGGQAPGAGEAASGKVTGLFVLGELSEELGTVRGKIAARINETLFDHPAELPRQPGIYGLTSDVGLRVVVVPDPEASQTNDATACGDAEDGHKPDRTDEGESSDGQAKQYGRAKILCTTCDLDTDRIPYERYHPPEDIYEVCVKGENEGIFHNCGYHDPQQQPESLFLEQLERFDLFGR